jgi:hypothetical protein
VKELFLLYLSSLRACGPPIQYPKLARDGAEEEEESKPKQPYKRQKKIFNQNSSSAHSKPNPEIYSVLRKAALRTANIRVFL